MLDSLFNKVADLRPATLLKTESNIGYFPMKFAKYLRKAFFYRTPPVVVSALNGLITVSKEEYGNRCQYTIE